MKTKITDDEALAAGITRATPCETRDGIPGWSELVRPILAQRGMNPDRCIALARHPDEGHLCPEMHPTVPGVVFVESP